MALKTVKLKTEFCVVGGGVAGIHAAITAAREGVKTVIVQERPVYGGNASSEIRMWICGTGNYEYKETGLSEEINLQNYYFNPGKNYNLWGALLFEKINAEENITPLLNCTCFDAQMKDDKIVGITAYQMTTQTLYEIEADNYADCSGDSILAPLTGAKFMYGRESKDEYDEPIKTHEVSDGKTMGNSCLIQARKVNRKVVFRAPDWAEKVPVEKLKSKNVNLHDPYENFWYIEIGGTDDVIGNAEKYNKRLLALCLGVWDTIKNSGEFDADYYDLDFLGFLGAKRESRRMLGDYVMTANDILNEVKFPDTVAYGGWPMDDHYPEGFDGEKSNYTISVPTYGIAYRCLYSKNIGNLFFAGRNISLTHLALSSARVMGTCATLGQAVGVAASFCKKYGVSPRGVSEYMEEMQQTLLKIDCFLPAVERKVSELNILANFNGDKVLHNGKDRDLSGENNCAQVNNGETLSYTFAQPKKIDGVKIVFDSDLLRKTFKGMSVCEREHSMRGNIDENCPEMFVPTTLCREYSLCYTDENGENHLAKYEKKNLKRNVLLSIDEKVRSVSLTVISNWGNSEKTGVYTFELF